MKLEAVKKRTLALITEIDGAELAVRMCEASYGLVRPTPSARAALNAMEPEVREVWLRAAHAAVGYWQECIEAAQRPS